MGGTEAQRVSILAPGHRIPKWQGCVLRQAFCCEKLGWCHCKQQ